MFESRIGHTNVAGAAARSFPKLTRPPNAGGGAAMSKESVAEAKKRADALAKKKKAAEVPRPRPYITARGCSSVAERPLCMRKAQGSNPCSSSLRHSVLSSLNSRVSPFAEKEEQGQGQGPAAALSLRKCTRQATYGLPRSRLAVEYRRINYI